MKDIKQTTNKVFNKFKKSFKDFAEYDRKEMISGQMIEPCKDCSKIYCETVINGKCQGNIKDLNYCVLCKADLK